MNAIHNNAKKEDISNIVLMSGDPLRIKYIAENYLDNYKLVNDVRGMLTYTGYYKGKRITLMGHGMGIPSMAIYAYELFKIYDVDLIIRMGSCGCSDEFIKVGSTVIVTSSNTENTFARQFYNEEIYDINGFDDINNILKKTAKTLNINLIESDVTSSDIFDSYTSIKRENKSKVVEMESFALFLLAHKLNKKAACLLTVSDNNITKEILTSEERQKNLNDMIMVSLESTLVL